VLSSPYLGDFDLEVGSDGSFAIPHDWAGGESSLRAVAGAVAAEECIRIYPASGWARVEVDLHHNGRILQVPVYSLSVLSSGRLVIPRPLLDTVGIRDRLHASGAYSWLELWAPDAWTRATCRAPEGEKSLWDGPVTQASRGCSRE
jgi:DNA-binding transcriptional regulator/RsmH inhibitor MraZ